MNLLGIKRLVLISFFIFSSFYSNAQYKYSIVLIFPDKFEKDTLSIDIDNILENKSFRIPIKGGKVSLNGKMLTAYSSAKIYFEKDSQLIDTSFYFGVRPVTITCHQSNKSTNPFLESTFTNIYFQDLSEKLDEFVLSNHQRMKKAYSNFKTADSLNTYSLKKIFLNQRNRYENDILYFLAKHKSSYFSLYYFNSYFVNRADYSNADSLLNYFLKTFPQSFIQSKEGNAIQVELKTKKIIIEGSLAPNFISLDINKKQLKLVSSIPNQYTLIQFWASWCGPCIREIPLLKTIRDKYSEERLRMISISIDSDLKKWKSAVRKYKVDWLNVNNEKIQKAYGVSSIPLIYLISPDGLIIYSSDQTDVSILENLLYTNLKGVEIE